MKQEKYDFTYQLTKYKYILIIILDGIWQLSDI